MPASALAFSEASMDFRSAADIFDILISFGSIGPRPHGEPMGRTGRTKARPMARQMMGSVKFGRRRFKKPATSFPARAQNSCDVEHMQVICPTCQLTGAYGLRV